MKLKSVLLFLVYALFLVLLLEAGLRLFLVTKYKLSFFSPKIIYRYYPGLKEIDALTLTGNDGYFDMLLLGGSVLNKKWGAIESELYKQLGPLSTSRKKIRIHNLSQVGHSSLDSKIKYDLLKEKHFDFVIFYHGINEIRANNCPPSVFKSDYSHYAWYQDIYRILRHKEIKYTVIPYFADLAIAEFMQKILAEKIVPARLPKKEWIAYGKNIQMEQSFKRNVLDVIQRAKSTGDPILVMTFAYYIPDDYSLKKFNAKQLDYDKSRSPIEIWGEPANVKKGLEVHNRVIQGVASDFQSSGLSDGKFFFLDMNTLISKNRDNFDDVCHLTGNGSREFVSYVVPIIKKVKRF